MRIAYVCADGGIPVFGAKGASVHVQEVLRALLRAGCEVELFATRLGGAAPNDLRAIAVQALPPLPEGDVEQRARAALAGNEALSAALAAQRFDAVYERYSLWSHAGMAHARSAGIAGLLEVNAPLIDEQKNFRELPLPERAEQVARSVFADAGALLAVSPGVAAYLEGFAEARGRIHVVPNAVDPVRFASAAGCRRVRGALTVGFLGTLKPWHGLPTLIAAFAIARERHGLDLRLLLVGDGPERARIEADLAARGLGAVAHLVGAVAPAHVPELLADMDIAVAPYPASEGFYFSPLKLYEYMAAGLPVVASDVGHLSSVIHHGVDGLLVPPDAPEALADALAELAGDPALRARLGGTARARVLREHTWDAVAERVLALARAQAPHRKQVAA